MQLLRKPTPAQLDVERAATPADAPSDTNTSLVEAIVCETHSAALLTAAVTSAINAFKNENTAKSEAALKPYTPREQALITNLRNGLMEVEFEEDTVGTIGDFFAALAPARIALDRYFADANHIGPDRASALHFFVLCDTWRQACELALIAVKMMNADFSAKLSDQSRENSAPLTLMLTDAAGGGSACLDGNGQIQLPNLPQRRLAARRTVCQPCTITANRRTSQAFVRDVSPGGFGLERVPALRPRSLIIIELPNGRRFTGVVAWCKGTAAGVELSKSLLPNDPLLSG